MGFIANKFASYFFGPGEVLAYLRRKITDKKAKYHFDFTMAPKDEERAG